MSSHKETVALDAPTTPLYQRILTFLPYIALGFSSVNTLLEPINNVSAWVTTFRQALIFSAVLLGLCITLELLYRRYSPRWETAVGQHVRLRGLGKSRWLAIGGALVLLYTPPALNKFRPPEPPIRVTPSSLDIVAGPRLRRAGFMVHNTQNRVYYDVCIQIGLELEGIDRNAVVLAQPDPTLRTSNSLKNGDIYLNSMPGVDRAGNPAIWAHVAELHPLGKLPYAVELRPGVQLTPSSKLKARVNIVRFGDVPTTIVEEVDGLRRTGWINCAHSANQIQIGVKGGIPPHLPQ